MLRFLFTDAAMERPAVRDKYDLLIGVVATFVIEVSGAVIYSEVMFPVVELRAQLASWLRSGFEEQSAFRFESLESEESDLVTLSPVAGGWTVAARDQLRVANAVVPGGAVESACTSYIADVDEWARTALNVEVGCFV
jgi:hypothetical protein